MKRQTLLIGATLAPLVAASGGASLFLVPSNIDPANKFSWSENAGWMNWADANGGADGVFVDADFLSGSLWMENAGWVNVGDGGGPYMNVDNSDFGVNILAGGNLAGYAWGENIGWINFDTSSKAPDQARFDVGTGRFRGYAWGENIGWINLDDATSYVATISTEAPTIGNDTCVGGVNNGQPCAQHSDCPDGFCQLKDRFITAEIPATATAHGVRVTLVSIDVNSVATPANYDGTDRWAGAPSLGVGDGVSPSFNAAKLQCTFTSLDWSTVGPLHIYGDVVVPGSTYDAFVCSAEAGPCSTALRIGTAKFGDIVPPLVTSQPNFQDIVSIVDKFQNKPTGPSKTRTKLREPVDPAAAVSFLEVSADVDAFKGKTYKQVFLANPATCP